MIGSVKSLFTNKAFYKEFKELISSEEELIGMTLNQKNKGVIEITSFSNYVSDLLINLNIQELSFEVFKEKADKDCFPELLFDAMKISSIKGKSFFENNQLVEVDLESCFINVCKKASTMEPNINLQERKNEILSNCVFKRMQTNFQADNSLFSYNLEDGKVRMLNVSDTMKEWAEAEQIKLDINSVHSFLVKHRGELATLIEVARMDYRHEMTLPRYRKNKELKSIAESKFIADVVAITKDLQAHRQKKMDKLTEFRLDIF